MLELKKAKTLTVASLLVALGIIAGFFKLRITEILEIRFGTIPLAAAGAFFGPGVAAVVGVLSDLGGYVLMPTGPYFPGFTVSGAVTGIIFGLILGKKNNTDISIFRVTAAVIINTFIVNLIMNSIWLSILYGKRGILAVMSARLFKELVMIPINVVLIMAVLKPIAKLRSMEDQYPAD